MASPQRSLRCGMNGSEATSFHYRKWTLRNRTNNTSKSGTYNKRNTNNFRGIAEQHEVIEASRNVMAHAQKPDFVFRRNGRVHLNRRGATVQSTGSRGVRMSGSNGRNAGYTMFRGSVKFPLHFPSRASPCAITFQLRSTNNRCDLTKTIE